MSKKYVVVTTGMDRRGVFGGMLESYDPDTGRAVLTEARMAVYWSRETRGALGLAAIGPQPGSRISPAAPRMELNGVTAVMDCTDGARALWEDGPWQQS
jgi:hypothetical protein